MAEHFKRNFGAVLKDMQGSNVINPLPMGPDIFQRVMDCLDEDAKKKVMDALTKNKQRPLTLSEACVEALCANQKEGSRKSQSEQLERVRLAQRLNKLGMVKITPAERDIIKTAVYDFWLAPVIAVQVYDLLEGNEFEPVTPEKDEIEPAAEPAIQQ